ncbi:MAG: T9SS type A sorting domain-containing protein [candidate division KSB1 bacterium]|nr:T9SS type A sorting domain-containing protein [candidate division KSB1 bacterium]
MINNHNRNRLFILGFSVWLSWLSNVPAQVTNYFPLHIGDYWIEHTDSIAGQYRPTTMHRKIEGTNLIQGKTYFRMKEEMKSDDGEFLTAWYTWLRINNNAVMLGAFGEDSVIVDFQIPFQSIIVNGDVSDWVGLAPLVTDPQGDDTLNYPGADIQAIYAAQDGNHLFLRMDLWENANTNFRNTAPPEDGRYGFEIETNGPYSDLHPGICYDGVNLRWSLGYNGSNWNMPSGLEGPEFVGVNGNHIELKLPLSLIGNPTKYYRIEGIVSNYSYESGTELDRARIQATEIFTPEVEYIPATAGQIGATWEFTSDGMGGRIIFLVKAAGLTVQTPAGTFNNCVEMQITSIDNIGDTTQVTTMYMAEGIGQVRNHGWERHMSVFDFVLTDYSVQVTSPVQVVQQTTPVSGQSLPLVVEPPQNYQPTTSYLYYRFPGETGWSQSHRIALNPSGNQLNATIPAGLITYRGLEYYIELDNGVEKLYFPGANPQHNPAALRVTIDQHTPDLSLQGGIYKMVSVPMLLNDPAIGSVLGDDYHEYDTQLWRLFRWLPGENKYVEYPVLRSSFVPGNAFWLVTRWGENFDVENGVSMDTSAPFELFLEPGWNQVANPFPFPVPVDSCEADTSIIERPVSYDGNQYHYNVSVVEPWEGYFVFNKGSTVSRILIPPIAASPGIPKYKSGRQIDENREFLLRLVARIPGTRLEDSENFIGFLQQATDDIDAYDFAEPPPIGEYVRLTSIAGGSSYAGNFKPLPQAGNYWNLMVSSTVPQKTIDIQLQATGWLPANFHYYLLDEDYGCRIPINNNSFQIVLSRDLPERRLKLIVGTEEYADANRDEIPLTTLDFVLGPNYPNPFNAEITIHYQLARRERVSIIIYNLQGQKIRTLVDRIQQTGSYNAIWDGLDDSNQSVASGVYFVCMKAENFSATNKLTLVR